jgi:hypothetical protein
MTMLTQDSIYQHRPWSQSQEQQLTNYLRELTDWPAERLALLAPPVPNVGKPPPRGRNTTKSSSPGAQHVLTINDIAIVDDLYPTRVDYSQQPAGYSGTQFPALGVI